MSDEKHNLPDQKELEKEISDYLSKKYGRNVKIVSAGLFPMADKEEIAKAEQEIVKKTSFDFNKRGFTYLRSQIVTLKRGHYSKYFLFVLRQMKN